MYAIHTESLLLSECIDVLQKISLGDHSNELTNVHISGKLHDTKLP